MWSLAVFLVVCFIVWSLIISSIHLSRLKCPLFLHTSPLNIVKRKKVICWHSMHQKYPPLASALFTLLIFLFSYSHLMSALFFKRARKKNKRAVDIKTENYDKKGKDSIIISSNPSTHGRLIKTFSLEKFSFFIHLKS